MDAVTNAPSPHEPTFPLSIRFAGDERDFAFDADTFPLDSEDGRSSLAERIIATVRARRLAYLHGWLVDETGTRRRVAIDTTAIAILDTREMVPPAEEAAE